MLFIILLQFIIVSYSQKIDITVNSNIGITNCFVLSQIKYYPIAKIGYQAGINVDYNFKKFLLGSCIKYKNTKYSIPQTSLDYIKTESICFPVCFIKNYKYFFTKIGIDNNISLDYLKTPKELRQIHLSPYPLYSVSLFLEPGITFFNRLKISVLLFTDVLPTYKQYGFYNTGTLTVIAYNFSYGALFNIGYTIF